VKGWITFIANNRQRKIIHIDMDSFFASVEIRDNPQLKGLPIAVGGLSTSRGVVATCSYEARKFGVHSAMSVAKALQKCPSLIVVPVRMETYKQASLAIQSIFRDYTDLVEPLSLDEAYLDVTGIERCQNSATLMAQEIRQKIFDSQALTASAGIAPNKFLAKVASDWNKPNGQKVITPNEVKKFVLTLPVTCISGVGRVTAKKMHKLGLETCEDLQALERIALQQQFGKFGDRLYQYCRGIDERPVITERTRKSLSIEDTFANDLVDLASCLSELPRLYEAFLIRLKKAQIKQPLRIKNFFIKIRFNNFETTTLQTIGTNTSLVSYQKLCEQAWQRGKRPVRLIGLGVHFQAEEVSNQLVFKDF